MFKELKETISKVFKKNDNDNNVSPMRKNKELYKINLTIIK